MLHTTRKLPLLSGLPAAAALILAFGLGWAGPAAADPGPKAKLILHLVPVDKDQVKKANCESFPVEAAESVVTQGKLYPQHYLAYVLATDIDEEVGIAGVTFGITYDNEPKSGVDIISWSDCTLYEWHMEDWPQANTGNLLTWHQKDDCQRTNPTVVGYFYLTAYSPDRLRLIPRPVDGMAQVAACGVGPSNASSKLETVTAENLGWVDFGDDHAGYNPWDPDQNLDSMKGKFRTIRPGGKKN